jgi:hypothetical protein
VATVKPTLFPGTTTYTIDDDNYNNNNNNNNICKILVWET